MTGLQVYSPLTCIAGGSRGVGVRVRGALARIDCNADLGRRVFEDKLCRLADWAREAYLLCVEEPWSRIVEGLEWAIEKLGPKCIVSTDIGGDGVLLGYESMLGSYTTDAIARARLGLKKTLPKNSRSRGSHRSRGRRARTLAYRTLRHPIIPSRERGYRRRVDA